MLTRTTDTDKKGVTSVLGDYTRDLAAMLHGILEEDEVHDSVGVVVVSEGFSKSANHGFLGGEAIVHLVVKGGDEVGKDQRLRVLLLVELRQVSPWEGLLGKIRSELFKGLEVLWADKTITINTLALVSP